MANDIASQEGGTAQPGTPLPDNPEEHPYFVGYWAGYPNYGCPHCEHKTVSGPADIVAHINTRHPEEE